MFVVYGAAWIAFPLFCLIIIIMALWNIAFARPVGVTAPINEIIWVTVGAFALRLITALVWNLVGKPVDRNEPVHK